MRFARNGFFLLAVVFLFPFPLYAAVSITEIMYDAPGTDTKHEWVEVLNSGGSVDLANWRLFEGGTNHKLTIYAGSSVLGAGSYAVLADDPATFLADYPSYSGILFDTTFTSGLSNSGETLTLRDDSLTDQDVATYDPSLGAAGDGATLQKVGSSWEALTATPGSAPSGAPPVSAPPSDSSGSSGGTASTSVQTAQPVTGSAPVAPQIHAIAGDDRALVSGASSVFSGAAVGLKGEALSGARYVWSFGNGSSKEGQSVLYAFPYPGKYVVTLDVSSGGFSASDRFTATVVPAELSITKVTGDFIEITNAGSSEVDIGLWELSAGGKTFTFPAHTVIMADSAVDVSNEADGLTPAGPSDVSLLYPNGTYAAGYKTKLITAVPAPHASAVVTSAPAQSAPQAKNPSAVDPKEETAAAGFLPGASSAAWAVLILAIAGIGAAAIILRPRIMAFLESRKNPSSSS